MANNYLEELVAEWYEYNGFFIRRNIKVGKLEKGGYAGELDIIAFHPKEKILVHIEPTTDAQSWSKREQRYIKKFKIGEKYINQEFNEIIKKEDEKKSNYSKYVY